MRQEFEVKDTPLSSKSVLLLLASVAALPTLLLLPFMDHSNQLEPALAGSKTACMTNAALITHNLCSTWLEPQTIWPIALLFVLALLAFSFGLSAYASRLPHQHGRKFADYRFVTVIFVSILSFIAYALMRIHSQNYDAANFGITTNTVERIGGSSMPGPYSLVNMAPFGYGLTPTMVALLVGSFMAPAFVSWHQFTYSRNYIDGQSKQKLFQ